MNGSFGEAPGMCLKVGFGTKGTINRSCNCHSRHILVAVYIFSSGELFQFPDF